MSHRRPKRLAAAAFCLAAAASFAHAQGKPDLTRAAQAYLAGARALDRRDFAAAQTAFAQATALDPARADYNRALTATRDHRIADLIQQAARARITGSDPRADALLAEARLIDPTNELVLQHPVELPAIPVAPTPSRLEFAAPIKEQPLGLTTDLHLNGDVKQIVTQASRTFGLKVVFDESVTAQSLRFDLPETTYTQGFPLLLKTAGLFAVPVDTKTLLIAKDTQENRQKFERLVEETIYVPGRTPEQLNELTNIVKNVFDVKQAIVSAALNTLVLRAPEPTLRAVNATLDDLLLGDPQVVLELKLITIDKSRTLNTGANTPTSVGAFSLAAEAQSLVTANQSILQQAIASGALTLPTTLSAAQLLLLEALFLVRSGLATDANVSGLVAILGGGLTTLGISAIGSAGFNFALNTSDSRALDDITVRVGDRQTTTLRVGEKYPITTSTYTSGLSSSHDRSHRRRHHQRRFRLVAARLRQFGRYPHHPVRGPRHYPQNRSHLSSNPA